MMHIKGVFLEWFTNFFNKKTASGAIKNEIMSNKELAEELHKHQLLGNFKKEKYTHLLYIIFEVLILLICN